MAFDYNKDVRSALLPTTLISRFVGMGVIEYPAGHRRTILGLLYSFSMCIIYAICTLFVGVKNNKLTWQVDANLIYVVYWLYHGSHSVIVGLVIIGSIVCSKERSRCIMELEEINRIMKGMGVVRSYKRILVTQIWQFGCLVVMIISIGINVYSDIVRSEKIIEISLILQLFFLQYPYFISTLNDILFCNFNKMITASFEDLNALLKCLRVKNLYDSHDSETNLEQVNVVLRGERKIKVLYSIRKVYVRLACVARNWNRINAGFILALIVFSTWMFTVRIYTMYLILSSFGIKSLAKIFFIESALVSIFLCWKLFMIVHSAVTLTTEARRTCGILLWYLHPIASLRSEVRTFSTQLTQNPLHLSVFGLCSLDYSMLQQIFASAITYSVMFIQSKGSPSHGV